MRICNQEHFLLRSVIKFRNTPAGLLKMRQLALLNRVPFGKFNRARAFPVATRPELVDKSCCTDFQHQTLDTYHLGALLVPILNVLTLNGEFRMVREGVSIIDNELVSLRMDTS